MPAEHKRLAPRSSGSDLLALHRGLCDGRSGRSEIVTQRSRLRFRQNRAKNLWLGAQG